MPAFDAASLGSYIRQQREHAKVSVRELARKAGVSNPYLSQVERGLRRPSAEILQQIARALQVSAETLYVRAGLLDARGGSAEVTAALAGDLTLTEEQRRQLLDMYRDFQAQNAEQANGRNGCADAQARPRGRQMFTIPVTKIAADRSDHDEGGAAEDKTTARGAGFPINRHIVLVLKTQWAKYKSHANRPHQVRRQVPVRNPCPRYHVGLF